MIKLETLRDLIALFESSYLTALEIGEGAQRVRMEKAAEAVESSGAAMPLPPRAVAVPAAAAQPAAPEQAAERTAEDENYSAVTAPLVGMYHAAKRDGVPIAIGTVLKKGETACIVEAMKLMNSVSMPEDGEVAYLPLEEGEMVEYGQILLQYRPV